MSDDFDFGAAMEALSDDPSTIPTRPNRNEKTFPCPTCNGTGRWSGGMNRNGSGHCFACRGKGTFKTDPRKLAANRVKRAVKRETARQSARELNAEHGNGFLLQWLGKIADWNSFASSLIQQHNEGRAWSEKQVEACRRMYARMQERKEQREAERQAAPRVDASRIQQMFADALAAGKKRRALLAGHFSDTGKLLNQIKMTPAQDGERIWIKVDGVFVGGIREGGRIGLNRDAPVWLSERVMALAADPDGECRLYGKRTGTCSCCGRELTNADSIELGIGPICREKWGLA